MQVAILAEARSISTVLCGISLLERLLRTLERAGLHRVVLISSTPEQVSTHLRGDRRFRPSLDFEVRRRPPGPALSRDLAEILTQDGSDSEPAASMHLLLPADAVYDGRLIRALAARREPAALVDSDVPGPWAALCGSAFKTRCGLLCGPAVVDHAWLESSPDPWIERLARESDEGSLHCLDVASLPHDSPELRRELWPFWFPAPEPKHLLLAKDFLLLAAQKGAQDLPAFAHAPIERWLVARLCETRLTPNRLTLLCNVVAWCVTASFAFGHFNTGTIGALAVGVIDGVDGQQARVKLETTEIGQLEHWFDFLYEASWWAALAYSLQASGALPAAFHWWLLLYVSEGVDGLAKLSVIRATGGRLIDEMGRPHRLVRLVGGRRNVYVWILAVGCLFGNPAGAFVVLSVWEAATALVHIPLAGWAVRSGASVPKLTNTSSSESA